MVIGEIMVEPDGAFMMAVLGMPVSILTPPTAMMDPVMPSGRKKLPLASVTTPASISLSSGRPLPLVSM